MRLSQSVRSVGCSTVVFLLVLAACVAYLEFFSRTKVQMKFQDGDLKPIQDAKVTVERIPDTSIHNPSSPDTQQPRKVITQTLTDGNGTVTFSIAREGQKLRVTIATSMADAYTKEIGLSEGQAKQSLLEMSVIVPEEFLKSP